ncbi:SDR family NAD(P)-dependent oxidoreductase [Burkholderiaceae bacterium FT117]|uniref:SDR family NAD(P)-dependent oxidoreductase n=1 Tax=Zeimonas sediminis TaxID=2944268 RepID=UPI002342DC8B|nr:SDR family NAD(P)-dependent oxidoreductase [Zeimonas sediminis]MCM5572227.1 SDR family NAD(P)-dependent oxidoreductase [Zeimonas sediminis]
MRAPAPCPVSRLRRPRLLVVGCGDVGMRLLGRLGARIADRQISVVAVTRDPARRAAARGLGARTLAIDLDAPLRGPRAGTAGLRPGAAPDARRLGGLARWSIHLAPPPDTGEDDPRLGRLIAARGRSVALARRRFGRNAELLPLRERLRPPLAAGLPGRWTLIGTTGVYGDCGGAEVDEARPVAPTTARAKRRVAAERRLRGAVRTGLVRGSVLRVPGIYAHDRLPVDRLRRGLPAPVPAEDTYTNHVHAEDLAAIAWLALFRGRPGRTVNAVDDSDLRMGDWFDRVADACGLPRPPRLPRAELARQVSPMMLSFMSESRRLSNRRLKRELRVRLRWPTVDAALAEVRRQHPAGKAH